MEMFKTRSALLSSDFLWFFPAGSVQWRDYRSGEPRDLVSRVDWSARGWGPGAGRGCLQGPGVNIMTGAVRLMDDDDTDTAPDVDTECCVAAS